MSPADGHQAEGHQTDQPGGGQWQDPAPCAGEAMVQSPQSTVPSPQFKGEAIDSSNLFFVGVRGDEIVIMRQPIMPLDKSKALNLAAWLFTLTFSDEKSFWRIVEEIRKH